MKTLVIPIVLLTTLFSWSQTFEWAKSAGGPEADQGYSVTVDNLGNAITIGIFRGVVDFDPEVGVENLTSSGANDVFIQKLDSDGNFVWAKSFGGSSIDYGHSVSTDEFGNIYSTGYFLGTVDFDPGPDTYEITSSGIDIFVHKLDADGNFLWAKSFGSIYGDIGFSLTVDAMNNVLITGNFVDTVDFDPGIGIHNLTAEPESFNFFVLKLDSDGNFLWANSADGGEEVVGNSVITDDLGNVYTTGYFTGTVDFDPGLGESLLTSDYRDVFICKYDEDGSFLWARSFGGDGWDLGKSIAVDVSGNVYTTGGFFETIDFDPGIGLSEMTAIEEGIFIQKLDSDGNFLWATSLDGVADDRGLSISVGSLGNVYTTGFFADNIDFDPGPEVYNLTSAGGWDTFIQKLDPSGNFLWAESIGGTSGDIGRTILKDEFGSVWVTGYFSNTVDFDPGAGTLNLTSEGSLDAFTYKMSDCSSEGIDIISSCTSFTWIDGETYTEDIYGPTFILTNEFGCDSLVTLDFTLESSESIDEITTCDSLIWTDGITYYSNNFTATDTFTNIVGCDSIVTLNLMVNYSTPTIDTQVACDSFTWIDGETYTEDNTTATHMLTNVAGCDSIVTLNLTIHDLDLAVINEDPTLTALELDAIYQWLDCSNDFEPIPGANGISFIPEENGEYAVAIAKYGCSDTSDCLTVSTLNLDNSEIENITVYPNPSESHITITGLKMSDYELILYSVTGEVVRQKLISNKAFVEMKLPQGQYILMLIGDNETRQVKLVITG